MHRAVFVCSGNICRSPMAEGIFRAELARRGESGVAISMGTLGIQGRPASAHAVQVMEEIGIDVSPHRSQGVSLGLLRHATEIFAMERAHRDVLHQMDPALGARVVQLGAMDPEGGAEDIADPIGGSLDAYRACRDRLARCIGAWLDHHREHP